MARSATAPAGGRRTPPVTQPRVDPLPPVRAGLSERLGKSLAHTARWSPDWRSSRANSEASAAATEAAQIGAAIGREFTYELAIAVAPGSEVALRDGLVGAGLIFQRGVQPAAEYQFKHAHAAYGTLLRGPRQRLHQRTRCTAASAP